MRCFSSFVAALLAGAAGVCSVPLIQARDGGSTVELALNFHSSTKNWFVDVEIGGDSQKVSLVLDTGSADSAVMNSSNPYCSNADSLKKRSESLSTYLQAWVLGYPLGNLSALDMPLNGHITCSPDSIFDSSLSSSFHNNKTEFLTTFGDGSFAYGTYGTDTFKLGGTTVEGVQFAVINDGTVSTGIFAVGPVMQESASYKVHNSITYANVPRHLYDTGAIKEYSFAVSTNATEGTGSLLFGGTDSSKYEGDFVTLDIVKNSGFVRSADVNASFAVSNSSGKTKIANNYTTTIDIGSVAAIALPTAYLQQFVTQFSSVTKRSDISNATYEVECSEIEGSYLAVALGDLVIDIPLTRVFENKSKDGKCLHAFMEFESGSIILGAPAFDYFYSVFDYGNEKLRFAKVKGSSSNNSTSSLSSSPSPSSTSSGSRSTSSAVASSSSSSTSGAGKLTTSLGHSVALCVVVVAAVSYLY